MTSGTPPNTVLHRYQRLENRSDVHLPSMYVPTCAIYTHIFLISRAAAGKGHDNVRAQPGTEVSDDGVEDRT